MQNLYRRCKRLIQYWPSVMVLTLFFVAVAVIVFLPVPGVIKWLSIGIVVAFHFFATNRG